MDKVPMRFDGGVNLEIDSHLLKDNEWRALKNLWPYRSKLLGTRPSLLHEQDILPVPPENWNGFLSLGTTPPYPTTIPNYGQWFRHLTPLRALFIGSLDKVALICVCNQDNMVTIYEQFEGEAATTPTLVAGDVILAIMPNDLRAGTGGNIYPMISAIRLGGYSGLTPSLIEFNNNLYAANKDCEYVVEVVPASTIVGPTPTVWPNIDYRFRKLDFGPTNVNIKFDGVITYKNRFVYWRNNKVWFSDPFQPAAIYENAEATAYLGVFFDTNIAEPITAMTDLFTDATEKAGQSVLAIWTHHSMLIVQGEPATTIASTPEELFANCQVTRIPLRSGCISQASIVKTKFGLIWCGTETVWFMAKGNLPIEIGQKIMPRIKDQSFSSGGRIFATYDDECYRLVINSPGVGFNPYDALNEMWCLSFIGDLPNKDSAAWFGPQVFTNTDNPAVGEVPLAGGNPGLFCCAKLDNINDDKTWYIQPYSTTLGVEGGPGESDIWGTRLGLASITDQFGVDITAPFRMCQPLDSTYNYSIGALFQLARGIAGDPAPYMIDYLVTEGGVDGAGLDYIQVYTRGSNPLWSKRPLSYLAEATDLMPETVKIEIQSGDLIFKEADLVKVILGWELTFKTLNPIIITSFWQPWEPNSDASNIVTLESPVNIAKPPQNVLGNQFNEPVLTTRQIRMPTSKRYNGLEAQLNVEETDYKIIASNRVPADPNWNKIRISRDNVDWTEFDLLDFDENGIAKYDNVLTLFQLLYNKLQDEFSMELAVELNVTGALGFKDVNNETIYIDLTAQGWEWFGFVPTNLDTGEGVNIAHNSSNPAEFIYNTGSIPPSTPHAIHLAALKIKYEYLRAQPR